MTEKIDFMKKAIDYSLYGMENNFGGPFGAIVVKNGEIIADGWNTVTSDNDPTAHAEVNAIRNACKKLKTFDLSGCELYASCEPCPMCLSAIYWARLDKVYYANTKEDARGINFDDDFIYQELKLPKEERSLKIEQLGREDAIKIFKKWAEKNDKTAY